MFSFADNMFFRQQHLSVHADISQILNLNVNVTLFTGISDSDFCGTFP